MQLGLMSSQSSRKRLDQATSMCRKVKVWQALSRKNSIRRLDRSMLQCKALQAKKREPIQDSKDHQRKQVR